MAVQIAIGIVVVAAISFVAYRIDNPPKNKQQELDEKKDRDSE